MTTGTDDGAGAAARAVLDRYHAIHERIAKAEREAGREEGSVRLVAVTKTVAPEVFVPLIEAGHRDFGENRVQEAEAKWPALKERWPDLRLHLIGPLQSNKAKLAVALFDVIHTIDRDRIAAAIVTEMERQDRKRGLLIQVNTGAEPQKAGVLPEKAPDFVASCRATHGIGVAGLMCIPPFDEPPAPHFALLAKIAKRLALPDLSMGMTGDFETAIAFGTTHVRVGTALFGERPRG